jgi:spore coat polysaccharide biosynthesis predicted glycosyltransferase SpsG
MARADLAVSAGGQTLYELARCGTPTIAFCAGPDQAHNVRALDLAGAVVDAGTAGSPGWLDRLADAVRRVSADDALRTSLSRAGRRLIDGRGADRVRDAILRLLEGQRESDARVSPRTGRQPPCPR